MNTATFTLQDTALNDLPGSHNTLLEAGSPDERVSPLRRS
jgi:hypothetical protein